MSIGLFIRRRPRRNDNSGTAALKAVCNRLARAFGTTGHQNAFAVKFIHISLLFGYRIHHSVLPVQIHDLGLTVPMRRAAMRRVWLCETASVPGDRFLSLFAYRSFH